MASNPDDDCNERSFEEGKILAHPEPGEDIVISGLSGTYPNSLNVYDFRDNLLQKKDLVSSENTRWDIKHPEIPDRGGRIYNIEKFDAGFFGVHHKQAQTMDPMGRILLEKTFEAIIDAGLHPSELRGKKCGVFVGACFSEAEKTWFYEKLEPHGFPVTGCIRSMLANRLSYWLHVDGPSYTVDTACSSSMYALEHAYRAIRTGQCETAIVAGSNLCLHPYVTLQFARLGVLNMDGNCKCFDESADGYTRAEAVVVIVLQKSKNARRIYSNIIHVKANCDGYKEQGITYPSGQVQNKLLTEFYQECGVDPTQIEYVEAHGTGTKVGDPEEVNAIESTFCKNRKTPLYVGSVKSNIGHSEPASGLCSITKSILAMETGYLIPNINYHTPRQEMKALCDGRMQVVTEKMKWKCQHIAISSFGFGGANCHVLLKANQNIKVNSGIPQDDIPRLVYASGRTEEALHCIFDDLVNRPLDAEYIGLLHEVYKMDIFAHNYRGHVVVSKKNEISRDVQYYPYDNKPLWFVFSGLGSQWLGMGYYLIKFPVILASIQKMQNILAPKGINLLEILLKTDPVIQSTQTNVLIGITAIQIAFVDFLMAIDVKPVGVVAHSIGNLACAYYDGSLTLEQAILCAYYLGQASDQCKNAVGSIVSVYSTAEKVKPLLVSGLQTSNNSEKNILVSGNAQKVNEFVIKLKQQNIKYEEINSNIAYHSSLSEEIASSVLKHIKEVIRTPAKISDKWLTSQKTNTCSAEFISSILTNFSNFEDVLEAIPYNAVTLEISPRDFFQHALKRSELDDGVNIPLMHKDCETSEFLLTAIGKLYATGYNPRIEKIYPKVSFPVSRGTPMLSPLVRWDHSQNWFATKFEVQDKIKSGERTICVKLNDEGQEFLAGHVIDGRTLYPATGYLALVWETIGLVRGQQYTELPIVFKDVKFLRATSIPKEGRVYLIVMVQKVSGNFEVIEGGTAIVTGRAYIPDNIKDETIELPVPVPEKKDYYVPLNSRDIYKELRLRGYNYSGLFRGLNSCDTTATVGEISWKDNWVAFMDTILQIQILNVDTRGLYVPTAIQSLAIDVDKHKKLLENMNENKTFPAYVYKDMSTIICGGVEIRNLEASAISRKKILGTPVIETYKFLPYELKNELTLEQSVRVFLHTVLENGDNTHKIKTAEVLDENFTDETTLLSPIIVEALADLPLKQPDCNVLTTSTALKVEGVTVSDKKLVSETNCMIVIANELFSKPQLMLQSVNAISNRGFIITREKVDADLSQVDSTKIHIIADHIIGDERLILLKKVTVYELINTVDVTDLENNFEWISNLQTVLKRDSSILIYAQGDDTNGIIGFVNCLQKEPGMEQTRCLFIMDKNAPKFDLKEEFYQNQLKKNLTCNIYKNGQWGGYRHLLMEPLTQVESEHAYVNVTVRGDLSSLRWLEGPLSVDHELDCNKVLVHTYYSAMNFRDIMTATGRIAPEFVANGRFEQDCVQGLEYAGRLSNGRRVIGMVSHLATATLIAADPFLCWDIPDQWTMEEAVTIPVVYGTVLFAFIAEGKIKKGMTILIHSGTGGVGQAAITVALHYGCTVFVTVGSQEKRDFIRKKWPQIKDNQIGSSRDITFEQMIMTETNGRGVDLLLNSLAEEKLVASARCLAPGGKFLEIGKFDLSKDNPLPMHLFKNGRSFHAIMLDTFFTSANVNKQIVFDIVDQGIKSGAVQPLERCVFEEHEILEMFRFMSAGKHMGKVLLKVRDEEPERLHSPSKRTIMANPRYFSRGDGSYIITGGLGGFGLELVDWLILRGVRKLVLISRKGISTGYQAMRIRFWKSYGVDIVISTEDITTYEGCQRVIEQAQELGPVEAFFNLAVVLRDSLFDNLNKQQYIESFGPKALATKHFDVLTRSMCPELKQFVIFSSVSCGRGNAGQTNYGMANSIMERICEKRHEDGLPALAVEWGAVGDVGLVAEMQEEHTDIVIGGTLQQKISNCLTVLDQFLRQKNPVVASMLVAEKRSGDGSATDIVGAVVNILGIRDIRTVSTHSSLAELGMDSIMAVEIKQTLEREFEVFLTPQDIRGMTFARLYEIASEKNEANAGEPTVTESEMVLEQADMALNFVFRTIGDEEKSKKPIVFLPSQASEDSSDRVLMIPGLEGMASALETMGSHLTMQAICLQLGFDNPATSIEEMAASFYDKAIASLPDIATKGFMIVGYSFGAVIALELVALLEASGYVGQLVLIDGSPASLKAMADNQVMSYDEDILQNKLLQSIIDLIIDVDRSMYLKAEYEQKKSWGEKLDTVLQYTPKDSIHSKEYYRNLCESLYKRLLAILAYEPKIGKLKSKIKLLKPSIGSVVMPNEDFGLSQYSQQPIEIIYVEGNHLLIVENKECALEINRMYHEEKNIPKENIVSGIEHTKSEQIKI